MRLIFTVLLLEVLCLCAVPASAQEETQGQHRPTRVLGELSFPTTAASPEAQAAFVRGMLLLHLFEYPFARDEFLAAQALEPGFPMAVWGEAMTWNHPIWDEQDVEAGRAAMGKLGDTPGGRIGSTPAAREQGFLSALEALYGEGTKKERDRQHLRIMERLAAQFPEDHEVQLFYALAVFGVHAGVRNIPSYMLATALADSVFAENPRHPGAAHYLIHGVDDPVHAVLGLRAARALAEMAPDAAHAQHMTSHIFNALGMWDDMVIANEAADEVSDRMRAEHAEAARSFGHYNFWLLYGYLQQGRVEMARKLLAAGNAQAEAHGKAPDDRMELDPDRSLVGSVVQMWLRYLIETGGWDGEIAAWTFRLGDAFDPNLNFTFAQAMRASHALLPSEVHQHLEQFRRLKTELSGLVRRQDEPAPSDLMYLDRLAVMEQQILAMLETAKAEYGPAAQFAAEASRLEGEMPRAFGPPYVDYPSAQLLGEILLEAGDPAEAAEAFTLELERNRQRSAAIEGLIRAQTALGNETEASYYRRKLALIWHLADEDVRKSL